MHPVGELLRKTRTEKGLSLEQAAMSTRIRKHYLEALERGDREALPSHVQGRGFLRLYAGYLGLPAEDLVADWENRPHPAPPLPPPPRKTNQADQNRAYIDPEFPKSPPEHEPVISEEDNTELKEIGDEYQGKPQNVVESGSLSTLVEIGIILSKQRERLGLSLDDVERYTHIRGRYLIALEAGRLDQLPSTVQSRGMLSNYSVFLNLDSESIMLRFADALQTRRIELLPKQADIERISGGKSTSKGVQPASIVRRFLTPDLYFGAVLVVVLFIFVIWTVSRLNIAGSFSPQATLPSVSEILLATSSPTAEKGITLPSPSVQEQRLGGSEQPLSAVTGSPQPGVSTATIVAINSDPLQVYIIANQRSFMRVTVDGELRFNGRLIPGNAYPYSGMDRIDLIIGNAGAVQVYFNQQELTALAGSGEAASISFTQEGIQTPTPRPTSTATATPQVTVTPANEIPTISPTITPLIP